MGVEPVPRDFAFTKGAKPTQLAPSVPHVGVPQEVHIHEVEPEEGYVVCCGYLLEVLQNSKFWPHYC